MQFDPTDGTIGPECEINRDDAHSGYYDMLNGTLVVLFRNSEGITLQAGGRIFALDGTCPIEHRITDSECVFTVGNDLEIRYPFPPDWETLSWDPTPHVEREDFDFGLHIANVMSDPERTALLRANL
ncbi:hypothetical protein ACFYNO_41090 [Kitasatospora sp. NPDC006697]|uniref:hypothetical protein n=1 Tax=Kitasatospora sp. NPDC006697 TaxID=3364020 RepID=UPI0036D0208C